MSILYGENTFSLHIENLNGPDSVNSWPWSDGGFYDLGARGGKTALPYMRQFNIEVRWTDRYRLQFIRDRLRYLVNIIQALSLPTIDFLRLEVRKYVENESEYEDEDLDGRDWENCVDVLRMWLGLLRNVREVCAYDGQLGKKNADILRSRWRGQGGEESRQLVDMYEKLETVVGIGEVQVRRKLLHEALRAAETDDLERFNRAREAISKQLRAVVEAWKEAGMLEAAEEEAL
ncbi:hypothetical protein QBC34DRAFT_417604 [Podospora aff. communis PSN243]|uniref:Uncharacterized protein n=1 Tax=Podospora aff. communis PSN243 TaxID=3040156 RepID=A0AAV9G4R4_9PEZI|nr:hypothetical protein QBC34DRAFT_417604 [Podospora aff. communis PSN243]